jgi:autoinducer 2-degrading protein
MGNFVLIVEFTLHDGMADKFMPLIGSNARESVEREPGCRQFDVLRVLDDPNRVVLYEVYDDLPAFDAHREMEHVKAFFREADALIAARKMTRFERVVDGAKPPEK